MKQSDIKEMRLTKCVTSTLNNLNKKKTLLLGYYNPATNLNED